MLIVVMLGVLVVALSGFALLGGWRARIVLAVAVVVVAAGAALAWFSLAEPAEWDEVVVLNDRTVRVSYTGSECEDSHSASVEESDSQVTIKVTTREWPTSCSDVGFRRSITVKLNADLGSRKLMDGNCRGSLDKCERTTKSE